jgi:hypothetical protein
VPKLGSFSARAAVYRNDCRGKPLRGGKPGAPPNQRPETDDTMAPICHLTFRLAEFLPVGAKGRLFNSQMAVNANQCS